VTPLAAPGRPGVRVIAEHYGISADTVQRISKPRPFPAALQHARDIILTVW
jgi:hypothetical protein